MTCLLLSVAFFTVVITILYIVFLLPVFRGLIRLKTKEDTAEEGRKRVSIVVACRNEEKNLSRLLKCISEQDYPCSLFEVILVDDHSEDDTLILLEEGKDEYNNLNISVLSLSAGSGKKMALRLGIENARGEYVLCTDADCEMNPAWIKSMTTYAADSNIKIVLGPVSLKPGKRLLAQLQMIENMALQSVTAGSATAGRAVMGNGANMLFLKSCYSESAEDLTFSKYASGDDVFLIHETKKRYGGSSICFSTGQGSLVTSCPERTLKGMFRQHVRWASKSKGYRDKDTLLLQGVTALINLFVVFLFFYSFLNHQAIILFCGLILVKSLSEYPLIWLSPTKGNMKLNFSSYLISSMIYPFFAAGVMIISLVGQSHWKGRKVK